MQAARRSLPAPPLRLRATLSQVGTGVSNRRALLLHHAPRGQQRILLLGYQRLDYLLGDWNATDIPPSHENRAIRKRGGL